MLKNEPLLEIAESTRKRNLASLERNCGQQLLDLLRDPRTIEIMLNPDGQLWHERLGEPMKVVGQMPRHKTTDRKSVV